MRILIIEDDLDILHYLKENLESKMFAVDTATQGDKGSYTARTNEYDCVILDYVLPHKDGAVVCREIRESGKTTPIIMLTICEESRQKVELLNCGADDYITKPFDMEELVARIRAVMRRSPHIEETIFTIDNLVLDRNRQRVTRAGRGIYLTRKEFNLLEFMLKYKGNVVSRGMIMEHVWSVDTNPFSNTIEAHILNLRRKVDTSKFTKLIHSVPGRGYKVDIKL